MDNPDALHSKPGDTDSLCVNVNYPIGTFSKQILTKISQTQDKQQTSIPVITSSQKRHQNQIKTGKVAMFNNPQVNKPTKASNDRVTLHSRLGNVRKPPVNVDDPIGSFLKEREIFSSAQATQTQHKEQPSPSVIASSKNSVQSTIIENKADSTQANIQKEELHLCDCIVGLVVWILLLYFLYVFLMKVLKF
jgi:Fe2+ transport system protein B